ncbi:MAG TPA: hypothetical protein VF173_01520 [Thermoanaerobaculia bacterium]|nr:hypothetical protein [Thermoanaerobaculia bacterium]
MENCEERTIHAVAFQSGHNWVAQCLEYDIATQAATLDALLYELERIVLAHVFVAEKEGVLPFGDIPKAPKRFWEMYRRTRSKGYRVAAPELPAPASQRRPTVVEVAFADAA